MFIRFSLFYTILGLILSTLPAFSQQIPEFGNISVKELSNEVYTPDPGADAIVLSDVATAALGYDNRNFFVEMQRDVRIRIVNNGGFDYADVSIPFMKGEDVTNYKASTFNLKNGQKSETVIPKENFIIEKSGESWRSLKFTFPDVHEGSVIEYTYKIRMGSYSLYIMVPWLFQREIPVALSSITIEYPETFEYKYSLSGSSANIESAATRGNQMFLGKYETTHLLNWTARNVPAFIEEPYILGSKEYVSKLSFELSRIDLPIDIEVTPSYANLSQKLLERSDFGTPLNTNMRSLTEKITAAENDHLSKLRAIHKYISTNIFWNGDKDYTTSSTLKKVLNDKRGNSAEINFLLITMARAAGISAEPVILSTRSNGSLNPISALLQQFDYVIARITIDGKTYLVDATDPLRPYSELPFECLNKTGRLISTRKSEFIDLANNERNSVIHKIELNQNTDGTLSGNLENIYSGYSALKVRNLVRIESEEGYHDILRSSNPDSEISEFNLSGLTVIDSAVRENIKFKIQDGSQIVGNEIIINPFQMRTAVINPFYSVERKYPIDMGCPQNEEFEMTMPVPEGYHLDMKPSDLKLPLGKDGGSYSFRCEQSGNSVKINSQLKIDKVYYSAADYKEIQRFYLKIQQKQSEFIIFKKN